nr:zinc finger protein 316 [Quercus suber]
MDTRAQSPAATSPLEAPQEQPEADVAAHPLVVAEERYGQQDRNNAVDSLYDEDFLLHLEPHLPDSSYPFYGTGAAQGQPQQLFQSRPFGSLNNDSYSTQARPYSTVDENFDYMRDHIEIEVVPLSFDQFSGRSFLNHFGDPWVPLPRASQETTGTEHYRTWATSRLDPSWSTCTSVPSEHDHANSVTSAPSSSSGFWSLSSRDHASSVPSAPSSAAGFSILHDQDRSISITEQRKRNTDKTLMRPFSDSFWPIATKPYGETVHLSTGTTEPTSNVPSATRQACEQYCYEACTKACSTIQSRGASVGRLLCTWGCGFSTDSRESWERHEEKRQPQHIYYCAQCLSFPADKTRRPYMHHRKDKFLEHARRMHRGTDPIKLRTLSYVDTYQGPFVRSCFFSHSVDHSSCAHVFSSWKERNDHHIAHFDDQIPGGPWYLNVSSTRRRLSQFLKEFATGSSSPGFREIESPATSKCWCGKMFQNLTEFKHHQRYHGPGPRPHRCKICDRDFVHRKDLARHELVHDKDSKLLYRCSLPECKGLGFSRKDHLARHLRNKHQASTMSRQTTRDLAQIPPSHRLE